MAIVVAKQLEHTVPPSETVCRVCFQVSFLVYRNPYRSSVSSCEVSLVHVL